jgi:hypothetical protein
MSERYLSLEECCAELRLGRQAVTTLIKQRKLAGIQSKGGWRILDPSPKLRESLLKHDVEAVPFLTLHEAAEILNMGFDNLRWHVNTGSVKAEKVPGGPHMKVMTIKEIRRLAARREKRKGPGRLLYSKVIYSWLRAHIEDPDQGGPKAAVLAGLIEEAVRVPEPRRSEIITLLWGMFDRVNELLEECK